MIINHERPRMDSQSQALTIPGELPNLNAVLAGAKRHWSSYSQVKAQQTNKVKWIARGELTPITHQVDIVFYWYTRDLRQDPDNVSHGAKYALDGLVEAGILQGDGRKHIRSLTHLYPEPDRDAPRVRIELIPRPAGSEEATAPAPTDNANPNANATPTDNANPNANPNGATIF